MKKCDNCRFSSPGGTYCGKGLQVINGECGGYLRGEKAGPIPSFNRTFLHDLFLIQQTAWTRERDIRMGTMMIDFRPWTREDQ